jgi:hypothetical protein
MATPLFNPLLPAAAVCDRLHLAAGVVALAIQGVMSLLPATPGIWAACVLNGMWRRLVGGSRVLGADVAAGARLWPAGLVASAFAWLGLGPLAAKSIKASRSDWP